MGFLTLSVVDCALLRGSLAVVSAVTDDGASLHWIDAEGVLHK